MSNSYTSIFSLFELIKRIDRSEDSTARLGVLKGLKEIDLKYVDLMPLEMFQAAFRQEIFVFESNLVKARVGDLLRNTQKVDSEYDKIVEQYEFATKKFQEIIAKSNAVPAPRHKTLHLNIHDTLSESQGGLPPYLKNLPPNLHPSRIVMESLKQEGIPALYRHLNLGVDLSNEEVLSLYNDSLDIYLFASFTYGLKRKSRREPASKNDLLDIIHTTYLVKHGDLIVSNDNIFASILPNINTISVEEYKKLI